MLFVDIESFLDSKSGFDLRKLSIVEYCRDPRFKIHGLGYCSSEDAPRWIAGEKVGAFLEDIDWTATAFIAHHSKFDLFALKTVFGINPKMAYDSKAMARAVLGRRVEDYSLRTLAKYFGLPEKGQMKTDGIRDLPPEQEKELADYCLHDVWLCREIYKRLEPEFPKSQYEALGQTIQMFVDPKLILDVPLLEQAAKEEKERKKKLFLDMGVDKKEFASNVKFPALLKANGYEVPTKKSPRTGKQIAAIALGDTEFLDMLKSPDENLRRLCEARKEAKSTLMETRSDKLGKVGTTGRWPFDVEYSGAVQTHRYSGGSGAGGNPQNFTRDSALRRAVEAPAGFHLVVGDFSNIETRLVAYLSGDPGLIQAFEQDEDLYCKFASAFFSRKITKENEEERRFGKSAILGLGYGMGPTKFQKTVRLQTGKTISKEEATKAVRLYRAMYNKVPALWLRLDGVIRALHHGPFNVNVGLPIRMDQNVLLLPSGLRIQYPNLRQEGEEWVYDVWGKKGQKEPAKLYGGKVLENICQALAGELCKEVMVKFGSKVVGQVHDEIILISDDPTTDRAELEAAMETPPSWLPEIKLKAEVSYGRNWLEAKA